MAVYSSLLHEKNISKRSKEIGQKCAERAMQEFREELFAPKKNKGK